MQGVVTVLCRSQCNCPLAAQLLLLWSGMIQVVAPDSRGANLIVAGGDAGVFMNPNCKAGAALASGLCAQFCWVPEAGVA